MKIETWNNEQLNTYIKARSQGRRGQVPGFKFLCESAIRGRYTYFRGSEYRQAQELTPLELQADTTLPNVEYDRHLIALMDNQVVGVLAFAWTNVLPNYTEQTFWRHYLRFLEVRRDKKRRGIATTMIQELDRAEFIQGNIVQVSGFTKLGKRTVRKRFEALPAESYALVPRAFLGNPPTRFGVHQIERFGMKSKGDKK